MSKNLQFFEKNINAKSLESGFITKADAIILECRRKLLVVTDEDSRIKLNAVIDSTCDVVLALFEAKDPNIIIEKYAKLKMDAVKLPMKLEQQSNLVATISNYIAAACIFILASSLAFSLGFAFYSLYFHGFEAAAVTNYLVVSISTIGIPSGIMGLFGHFLGKESNTEESEEVVDLQDCIDEFCSLAPSL